MANNWRAFWLLTGLKWKKTLTFRANLIAQATAMIINNLGFLLAWGLMFSRFGNINGYTIKEIVLIQGFVALFYAIFYWFFGGVARSLAEYVEQDRFLDLQLYPINPLVILTTKSGEPTQFGDFVEGIILTGLYVFWYPSSLWLILLSLVLIITGIYGMTLMVNCIIFFLPSARDSLAKLVENIYIGGSMYPSDNFKGFFRNLFFAIGLIPIVSYPVEAVRHGYFPLSQLLITVSAVILVNVIGLWMWKMGIRRLESGSGGGIIE